MTIVQFKPKHDITGNENVTKIITPVKYKTTDGKVFNCADTANTHQTIIDLAKAFVVDANVGGFTMRGNGSEYVKANNKLLERYTIDILETVLKATELQP